MVIAFLLAAAAAVPPGYPAPIDIGSWFSADDYPAEALKQGIEGSVFFEVDVDATGKPTACRIGRSSGSPILDQATCNVVLARAKFEPALDKHGKPVPGKYGRAAAWRLPNVAEPTYQAAILDFRADPAHPTCTIKVGTYPMGSPTCAEIMAQASKQQAAERIVKLVFLLSVGSADKAPYQGDPDWGPRLSYLVSDQYYRKGSFPIACISVAAEGSAAGRDACAGFPGARAISEKDKAEARQARTEQSIFAIFRSAPLRRTCSSGESAGEAQGCN